MSAIFGALGFAVNIWGMAEKMFPEIKQDSSTYKMYIGQDGARHNGIELDNAHGQVELVKTYNENYEMIGAGGDVFIGGDAADDSFTADDQFGEIVVDQKGNSQAVWTEFYAGDDAICVAAIAATMPDESLWGWTGDWGYWCGLNWFPSNYHIQPPEGQQSYSPRCTWIDKDHTNNFKAAAIGINWVKLSPGEEAPENVDELKQQCGKNMLAWDEAGGEQLLPMAENKKRGGPRGSQRADDRLIISSFDYHSAVEVCESETSWGSDFVAKKEGVYCNMETHEVVPLCDGESTSTDCFDVDSLDGPTMVRRNGKRSFRNATEVVVWE